MSIIAEREQKLVLVCIYDPLPLQKIWVDRIRQEKLFEIISILEDNVILLRNMAKNIESSIQLTRLEYVDSNNSSFDKRNLEIYEKLLQLLPPLRVKAIGINLNYTVTRDEDKTASEFIRDKFLKDKDILQNMLGNQILGNSTRIFYGEPTDHFDIRIYPVDLIGKEIGVAIHKHKDIDIAEQDTLLKMTADILFKTCQESSKIKNKLF